MKFLLNMNMPPRLAVRLTERGHLSRHASSIGLSGATDETIIQTALDSGEIILTNDLDYGRILAFQDKRDPSVVIFRVKNNHPDYLIPLLQDVIKRSSEALSQGCIIVVEDQSIRIRSLPIIRD